MFPSEQPVEGKRGRPAKYDNRGIMNGLLWIAKNGTPWRELPERYRKLQAVYACFRQWKQLDIFSYIIASLYTDADMENLSIDSTSCKVHQSANGEKNTKIHIIVDGFGNPISFLLSAGNEHDSNHAIPLLRQVEVKDSNIIGNIAYNSKEIRDYIIAYTIPPKNNNSNP